MTTEKRKTLSARASLLAVVTLAACVLLSAGVASARYFKDGAVQNGTTGGWNLPTDFVCIVGLRPDGTLNVAAGITSSRDCIYYTTGLKGMTMADVTATHAAVVKAPTTYGACKTANSSYVWDFVNSRCLDVSACSGADATTKGTLTWNAGDSKCYDSAACTVAGAAGNDGAKHALATSICLDGGGNGLSLTGLDRTFAMCAAKGGTWKQTSDTLVVSGSGASQTAIVQVPATPGFGGACVAYTRQFKGQDANGVPLAFGAKGTSQSDAGFCYASMDWSSVAGYDVANCPSRKAAKTCAGAPKTGQTCNTDADCSPSTCVAPAPFDVDAAYDWSVSGTQCRYAKSIAGKLSSNVTLTKADGTTTAPGTFVDLSTLTTMGDCLAFGASWNNWVGQAASTTTGAGTGGTYVRPVWDYQTQAPDADDGCLHCHSTTVEYNGPAERFKSSYLMTGHKNMLRKVTAGKVWAGPNADGILEPYTAWGPGGVNPIDWTNAQTTIGSTTYPLLYIFGDWMAPAPDGLDVIVNVGGGPPPSAKYNATSNYSCAPCHSTGWSDNGTAAASQIGLCVPSSAGTTQAACTGAGGIWYPAIGVKGIGNSAYVPQEPAASFPGIKFAGAGQWDVDGITCARCHNAAVGVTTSPAIAASQFKTTYPTSGGMGNIPGGPEAAGPYGVFVCYGCHQSIAKTNNGVGADNDLAHPENLPVKNSVTTGTCTDPTKTSESACQGAGGIWTPTAYVPMFNGHVLGGSFLNSVHGEATGTIVPNSLGKYDLVTNLACTGSGAPYPCCTGAGAGTCITFGSSFRGYTCWQSATSSSPALTWIDTTLTTSGACEAAEGEWESVGCVREIKDETTCENLYGAGAWRAASQGSCVTCHDVHNSLFVDGQEEKAMRKTCQNCHVDNATTGATVPGGAAPQVVVAGINHLPGTGTPFDPKVGESPCVVCHMPKPTSGDFPMHVWRINTDESYSTFPTAAQYGAGTVPTKKIANTAPQDRNDDCTAAGVPLACCTGPGTGTCVYTNAVWVDIDLACGQCHGGGEVEDAQHQSKRSLCTGPGVPDACCTGPGAGSCANYRPKAVLATVAATMHDGAAVTYPTTFSTATNGLKVNMYASVSCNGCSPTCEWTCGDGVTAQVGADTCNDASCTYGGAGTKSITLNAMENGGQVGTATRNVTLSAPAAAPPVPGGLGGAGCPSLTFDKNTWTASFTDASTPSNARVLVEWGDGSVDAMPAGSAFSHTYRAGGAYLMLQKVVSSTPQLAVAPPCTVSPATFQIAGNVKKQVCAGGGTNDGATCTTDAACTGGGTCSGTAGLGSATVSVRSSTTGATVRTVYTAMNGFFSVASLKPDTYWLIVTKRGYTFSVPADTETVGPGNTSVNIVATGSPSP